MMNRPIHLGLELGAQSHRFTTNAGKRERSRTLSSKASSSKNSRIKNWINGVPGRISVSACITEEQRESVIEEGGSGLVEKRQNVFVEVERCVGLKNGGAASSLLGRSGNTNSLPFVVIFLNGKEVGRTPPVTMSEDRMCTWIDETYKIPCCHRCQSIRLEVWQMITSGDQMERVGDFLGQATIPLAFLREGAGETKDLDLELIHWGDDIVSGVEMGAISALPSASSCSCPDDDGTSDAPKGPLHSSDKVNQDIDCTEASDLVQIGPSQKWPRVRKRAAGSSFLARPATINRKRGRYRIDNPHPYRRRDIREAVDADEDAGGSCISSTFLRALGLIAIYMLFGVLGFSLCFERFSIRDSLYLSVVTFTTVGFGDLKPQSSGGKLFSCVFALAGIGIIGIALGFIGQNLIQAQVLALQMANRRRVRENMDDSSSSSQSIEITGVEENSSTGDTDANVRRGSYLSRSPAARQLLLSLFPIAVIVLIGSLMVGRVEGWGVVDSIYFCIITGTSVGYGDFYPTSSSMKWFSVVYIPLAVGAFSAALGRIANIFVEAEIAKSNSKLLQREVTVEDLETMNVDGDGEVSMLEFVEHMLKCMNKVDEGLLDELHSTFQKLDADGSGGLEQDDLVILTERKLNERRQLILEKYRNALRRGSTFSRISAQLAQPVSPVGTEQEGTS